MYCPRGISRCFVSNELVAGRICWFLAHFEWRHEAGSPVDCQMNIGQLCLNGVQLWCVAGALGSHARQKELDYEPIETANVAVANTERECEQYMLRAGGSRIDGPEAFD